MLKDTATMRNFQAVGDEIDRLSRAMPAAPTVGSWRQGERVWNSEPAAGEYIGWVCVTSGSPGTWKGFGTIQS